VLPEAAHSINWELARGLQPATSWSLSTGISQQRHEDCHSRGHFLSALGLANRRQNGIFNTMKTTIDHAGRLVIPKDIRRESGIKPGMSLEVRWEKGAIAITPAPLEVKLERKGRLLVAVPSKDTPRLSADTVERTRKTLRKERSGAST